MKEMQGSSIGTGQVDQAAVKKNLLRDLFGVIFDPSRTFTSIIGAGSWVGIVLVILIVSGALEQIYHNLIIEASIAKMLEKAGDNPAGMQQAMSFFQNQAITRILYSLGTMVSQIVFLLIWTVLCFFLCSVVFGGTAKFKSVWIVCAWAYVIILLQLIVKTPLILATKSVEAGLNFGLIFGDQMVGAKLHNAISAIDLFGIWHFIIMGIGLAALYRFSTRKGIGIAFIIWLFFVIVGGTAAYLS
jgi:hypothetical protein